MPRFKTPVVALLSTLPFLSLSLRGQAVKRVAPNSPAATDFAKAWTLYYVPAQDGLISFHCAVGFPWKQFSEKASGKTIDDKDPHLAYLLSTKLDVHDDLNAGGDSGWKNEQQIPAGMSTGIDNMKVAFSRIWGEFFNTWNKFMTGDMYAITDTKTQAEHTPSGYRIWAQDSTHLAEEHFNNALLMVDLHVKTPEIDATVKPTFDDSPKGKVPTKLINEYRYPDGSSDQFTLQVQYATTGKFLLPSEVKIAANDSPAFEFTLTDCVVKDASPK